MDINFYLSHAKTVIVPQKEETLIGRGHKKNNSYDICMQVLYHMPSYSSDLDCIYLFFIYLETRESQSTVFSLLV